MTVILMILFQWRLLRLKLKHHTVMRKMIPEKEMCFIVTVTRRGYHHGSNRDLIREVVVTVQEKKQKTEEVEN